MRLLHVSDFHGSQKFLDLVSARVKKKDYDCLIVPGDFEERGLDILPDDENREQKVRDLEERSLEIWEKFSDLNLTKLSVTGEWDRVIHSNVEGKRDEYDFVESQYSVKTINGYRFLLIGMKYFQKLSEDSEEKPLLEVAEDAFGGVDREKRIVVSHRPLYDFNYSFDRNRDDVTAYKKFQKLAKGFNPEAWLCGHTKWGRKKVGRTKVLNADTKWDKSEDFFAWEVVLNGGIKQFTKIDLESKHRSSSLNEFV